jgi:hypothetical protein
MVSCAIHHIVRCHLVVPGDKYLLDLPCMIHTVRFVRTFILYYVLFH